MGKDFQKLFNSLEPAEPPAGLFDRIILAIKRERELQQTRRLSFIFLGLLVISITLMPFSWKILVKQMESSNLFYFVSAAISDVGSFFVFWEEFSLAILESLPVAGIFLFAINIALVLFTLRLFLYKKQFLLKYLVNNFRILNSPSSN